LGFAGLSQQRRLVSLQQKPWTICNAHRDAGAHKSTSSPRSRPIPETAIPPRCSHRRLAQLSPSD
jgi:hypothetical protein